MSGVALSGNNAGDGGGGAVFDQGTLTVKNGTLISGNKARYGGGIYNQGKLSLDDVTVSSNSAGTSGGGSAAASGGGIYNASGSVAITGGSIAATRPLGPAAAFMSVPAP